MIGKSGTREIPNEGTRISTERLRKMAKSEDEMRSVGSFCLDCFSLCLKPPASEVLSVHSVSLAWYLHKASLLAGGQGNAFGMQNPHVLCSVCISAIQPSACGDKSMQLACCGFLCSNGLLSWLQSMMQVSSIQAFKFSGTMVLNIKQAACRRPGCCMQLAAAAGAPMQMQPWSAFLALLL